MGQPKPLEQAFSEDGYLIDQDGLYSLRYRTMTANINCCGPVAAFNLLRALGRERPFPTVMRELEERHLWNVPGPTLMKVMRAYLAELVPEARETVGKEEAVAAASRSRAGIFRYREGRDPHFTCYVREEEGRFRFFNVADGLEDAHMTMEAFDREHLGGPTVIVFAVPEKEAL